jgi:hypothetical protein
VNPVDIPPDRRPTSKDWLRHPELLPAFHAHNFPAVYGHLHRAGYSENQIGSLTRQSQSEVSAIIHGRRLMAYQVIDRVITGLRIPRCLVAMATCCGGPCSQHIPLEHRVGAPHLRSHQPQQNREPHLWSPDSIDT